MEEIKDRKLVLYMVSLSVLIAVEGFVMGVLYVQEKLQGVPGVNQQWFVGLLVAVISSVFGSVKIATELLKRNASLRQKLNAVEVVPPSSK